LLDQLFSTRRNTVLQTKLQPVWDELLGPLGLPPLLAANLAHEGAAEALLALKPPATLLLQPATNAFAGTNQFRHWAGCWLLGCIGPGAEQATPWLAQGWRSTVAWEVYLAALSTQRLGPAARGVVPDIINLLSQTNPPVEFGLLKQICQALGSIGAQAAPAIPILKQRFASQTNLTLRVAIADALGRIDATESAALAAVLEEMRPEANASNRQSDIRALLALGPRAKAAEPLLLEWLADPSDQVWVDAASALQQLGTRNEPMLPLLISKLKAKHNAKLKVADQYGLYCAASAVARADPGNAEAIAVLIDIVKSASGWCPNAIQDLAQLGPAAKAAIPALREARASRQVWLRKAAAKALKQIEAPPRPAL
jgi:hypothetical protein